MDKYELLLKNAMGYYYNDTDYITYFNKLHYNIFLTFR